MDQKQSQELKKLRIENAELLAESAELRKMLGLMYENKDLRSALKKKEGKVRGISIPKRCHSEERDHKLVQHYQRVVGEIAFQLDRRILAQIFQEYNRFYGFLVKNVKEKILQLTTCPLSHKVDEAERSKLFERRRKLFNTLKQFGYDKHIHPYFTEYLVNTYGVLKDRPWPETDELESFHRPEDLHRMAAESMPCSIVDNVNIIIDCLKCLAEEDGKPFIPLVEKVPAFASPYV
ncbi:speriolin-like protein isoform X2 [Rhinoderma darwinii]|uniref:speriolin-like protein isoform X2 n=1 Tax=Rhinoderma darwinii TaxID=43563 RepID=UPI003F67DDAD